MKTFQCDHCGNLLFFENVQCVRCGHTLGYLPSVGDLSALEDAGEGIWKALAPAAKRRRYRQCANGRRYEVCNWLVSVDDPDVYCRSCRLTEVIPELDIAGNKERWQKLEQAKRWVIYTLMNLGLPLEGTPQEGRPPLRFRFLANPVGGPPVLTGHDNGVITLNIAEADEDERERRRIRLREPYRTLIGHFRHEVAHYYWDQLIANTPRHEKFRQLFGDESQNYGLALQSYYQKGPVLDWPSRFITAYASAHPWEDWAETWAHYLHMLDTLETAANFGIVLQPKNGQEVIKSDPSKVAMPDGNFDQMLAHWLPLTYTLNSLNRGMGLPDLYPFVVPAPTVDKLRFIHDMLRDVRRETAEKERRELRKTAGVRGWVKSIFQR